MIEEIIGSQNFEIIRDRIALILADELLSQSNKSGDSSINVPVTIEHNRPFDKTDLASIDVSLSSGEQDDYTPLTQDMEYTYFIDVITNAKSEQGVGGVVEYGDKIGSLLMQKIAGKIRAILMNSLYLTLGFDLGFIQNRSIKGFEIARPNNSDDTLFTSVLRFRFGVKVTEFSPGQNGMDVNTYVSSFRIGETDDGFKILIQKT